MRKRSREAKELNRKLDAAMQESRQQIARARMLQKQTRQLINRIAQTDIGLEKAIERRKSGVTSEGHSQAKTGGIKQRISPGARPRDG